MRAESVWPAAFSACARFFANDHVLGLSSSGLLEALRAPDRAACDVGTVGVELLPSADVWVALPEASDATLCPRKFSMVNADPNACFPAVSCSWAQGLPPEAVNSGPVAAAGSRAGRVTESNDGDAPEAGLEARLERPSGPREKRGREDTWGAL